MAKNNDDQNRSTRADVARLAGVSTAVVSYVFNNGPRAVAPATRKRVENAAKMLNYQPNATARALRTGFSRLIGVIVSDFSNPYFASINDALEREAAARRYSVLFLSSHADAEKEQECIARLLERNVDAIFGEFPQSRVALNTLEARRCPFILLDYARAVPNMKSVSTDFRLSAQLAAEHFFSHGHRKIDMLLGREPDPTDPRIQGWVETHYRHNIPVGDIHITHFTREGGYKATLELLDAPEPPTAIFAGSDLEAIGALRALHERGIRVPEDMAVISFDGTIDCLYSWPQLTTLQQDTNAIAKLALQTALDPDNAPDVQLVPAKLTIRHSCGC